MVTCTRFWHRTLLLKGAFNGFFAIAITAVDRLPATSGFAGSVGRELVKAPLEDKLLLCMLESMVIDITVRDYISSLSTIRAVLLGGGIKK